MVTPRWNQPTLEDIFGERQARDTAFSRFMQGSFPTASSGVAGQYLQSQRQPLEAGFTAARLLGEGNTGNFTDYLEGLSGAPSWGSGNAATRWGTGGRMGQLAERVGRNPQATGDMSAMQRALIANMRTPGGQSQQFNLGITPQMQGLPMGLRQSFYDLAKDRYNQVLGEQGTNTGFQFLPWLASQQGNMWGTA